MCSILLQIDDLLGPNSKITSKMTLQEFARSAWEVC